MVTKRKPKGYRVKFVYDTDAVFEECNGESRPLTADEYVKYEYQKDGAPVSYADYLAYYGNPDRHVYLGCVVETQCPCCERWNVAASVWCIDFMDDSPELAAVDIDKAYPAMDALNLPGYLADVARDELAEAGMRLPKPRRQHTNDGTHSHASDLPAGGK